jgi:hypothetical protein
MWTGAPTGFGFGVGFGVALGELDVVVAAGGALEVLNKGTEALASAGTELLDPAINGVLGLVVPLAVAVQPASRPASRAATTGAANAASTPFAGR